LVPLVDDNLWFHLYPLIIVDRQPRVTFRTGLCSEGLHNKNNMEYIFERILLFFKFYLICRYYDSSDKLMLLYLILTSNDF
jgi:hypothetical protein